MLAVMMLNRMRARRKSLREKQPKITRKQDKIEVSERLTEYCRTCLCSKDLLDIFYSGETANKRSEDLNVITGLQILLPPKDIEENDADNPEFKCDVCSKEFTRKQTFKAHVRSHNYYCICDECGKRCLCNSMLLQHKRAVHGLPKIHLCSYCDYSSATRAGLVIHERRHTGECRFVCEQCGARFYSRGGLIQHLPLHEEESLFECDVCQKREKSKRLLQLHYYKVHKEKRLRYICPICQGVFKSTGGARLHLAKAHGVARADQPALQRFEISVPEKA